MKESIAFSWPSLYDKSEVKQEDAKIRAIVAPWIVKPFASRPRVDQLLSN